MPEWVLRSQPYGLSTCIAFFALKNIIFRQVLSDMATLSLFKHLYRSILHHTHLRPEHGVAAKNSRKARRARDASGIQAPIPTRQFKSEGDTQSWHDLTGIHHETETYISAYHCHCQAQAGEQRRRARPSTSRSWLIGRKFPYAFLIPKTAKKMRCKYNSDGLVF